MENRPKITMSQAELEILLEAVALRVMNKMGIDSSSPLEMQRDFQHMRDLRLATEKIKDKGLTAAITVVVTGLIGVIALGIKSFIQD